MTKRRPPVIALMLCSGCGSSITEDEAVYYGFYCEECARTDWLRLQRWREGDDDRTTGDKPTVH